MVQAGNNDRALQAEVLRDDQAIVSVTVAGEHGDLKDPVSRDATDGDLRAMVAEAVAGGGVRGVRAQQVNLANYQVERYGPNEEYRYNRIILRPKTAFGL